MQIAVATEIAVTEQNAGLNVRTGNIDSQRLFVDDAPDGLNFWFVRNTFG